MPLYVHHSGEIVRAVPDRANKATTEARRLTASLEWRDLTEDQLEEIREGADPAAMWEQCPPTVAPAPARPRKSARPAPAKEV